MHGCMHLTFLLSAQVLISLRRLKDVIRKEKCDGIIRISEEKPSEMFAFKNSSSLVGLPLLH